MQAASSIVTRINSNIVSSAIGKNTIAESALDDALKECDLASLSAIKFKAEYAVGLGTVGSNIGHIQVKMFQTEEALERSERVMLSIMENPDSAEVQKINAAKAVVEISKARIMAAAVLLKTTEYHASKTSLDNKRAAAPNLTRNADGVAQQTVIGQMNVQINSDRTNLENNDSNNYDSDKETAKI